VTGYKEKRNVPVRLTQDELITAGKLLAKANAEVVDIENKKKESVSNFLTLTNRAKAEAEVQGRLIQSGEEYRDVECDVLINIERCKKTIIRPDTQEIVEECKLTNEDLQFELKIVKRKEGAT
jgi:hypothetical protein